MSEQYSTGTGATTIDPSKVNLTEADIEEYLWQNPRVIVLEHDYVERWIKRQYKVPSGIIDLFGITNAGFPVVVEVKNVPVDAKAIGQVNRYAFDIDNIFGYARSYLGQIGKVIVAPSADSVAFRECEASDVFVIQFIVSLDLSAHRLNWQKSFYEERRQQWRELANDKEFTDNKWLKVFEDITDEYSDIILGDSEDSVADAVEDYLEQTADEDENEAAV